MDSDLYPALTQSTRTQQVTEVLMQLITSKTLAPGQFLPSEAELCQRFGVSRPTLRQALRALEVRGLVSAKRGIGVVVTDRTREVATDSIQLMLLRGDADQDDLLEVRWALESQAAKLAATRATEADLRALNESITVMRSGAASSADYIEADLAFHLCLAEASRNAVLVALTNAISNLLREAITATYTIDGHTDGRLQDHKRVLDAVVARNPTEAEASMQAHLRSTERYLQELGLLRPPQEQSGSLADRTSIDEQERRYDVAR